MGLGGFLKKALGTVTKVASFVPGPIGQVAGVASRALRGRGPRAPHVNIQPISAPTFTPMATRSTPGLATGSQSVNNLLDRLQRAGAVGLADAISPPFASAVGAFLSPPQTTAPAARSGSAAVGFPVADPLAIFRGESGPPIAMAPMQKTIRSAPPGYVLVTRNGVTLAVLKSFAQKNGLWNPPAKPPISASDWKKLKTAKRVEGKAKRIAQTAGFTVRKSARR